MSDRMFEIAKNQNVLDNTNELYYIYGLSFYPKGRTV